MGWTHTTRRRGRRVESWGAWRGARHGKGDCQIRRNHRYQMSVTQRFGFKTEVSIRISSTGSSGKQGGVGSRAAQKQRDGATQTHGDGESGDRRLLPGQAGHKGPQAIRRGATSCLLRVDSLWQRVTLLEGFWRDLHWWSTAMERQNCTPFDTPRGSGTVTGRMWYRVHNSYWRMQLIQASPVIDEVRDAGR